MTVLVIVKIKWSAFAILVRLPGALVGSGSAASAATTAAAAAATASSYVGRTLRFRVTFASAACGYLITELRYEILYDGADR